MIGKVAVGEGFLVLCTYALNEDKNATVLVAQRVRWESAEAMAADFEVQRASLRPGLNQAVLHVALAWEPSETEKMTDKLMVTLAEEYLEEMGINPAKVQWALIRHHDQPHPHAHLIVNRVTHEGEAIDCGNNFRRSNEACRELEQRYGLVDAGERGEARTRELVEQRALGEDGALRQKVLDAMDKHMATYPAAVAELAAALQQERVTLHPEFDEQGKLRAVGFTHEDHPGLWVKGSALRRRYGGGELGDTLANNAEFRLEPPWVESDPSQSPESLPPSRYMLHNLDYVPAVDEPTLLQEEGMPAINGQVVSGQPQPESTDWLIEVLSSRGTQSVDSLPALSSPPERSASLPDEPKISFPQHEM